MIAELQSTLLHALLQLVGVNRMVLLLASVMLAVRPPPDGHNLRAVMTGVMLHAFRSVAVTSVAKLGYGRSSGVLASPADESAFLGIGEAVDLCGLVDYPKLPAQDLRRIQDVAFSMDGTHEA
ncbi:hypothetical protein AK812_SmicGene34100 [Symbiodinium microadriaticum]|uniref:Uncharacterized protein n=1 Tax=Symbiodinium microadriaticum TaxID=2951 RepID=A0A1Q9CPX1_SYMMI|nr:hypothetical protein AK812_SmicGene34100 [Symbiodinium microadriaticum]